MMRVLLVEDDAELAREMASLLRSEHFAVDVADNGVDALHLGDTENYDAACSIWGCRCSMASWCCRGGGANIGISPC